MGMERSATLRQAVQRAYRALAAYLRRVPLATFDLRDYTSVPWIGALILKGRAPGGRLSRALLRTVQLPLLLAPVATRRMLGIPPSLMAGGLGFYLHALCDAHACDGDASHLERAAALLPPLCGLNSGSRSLPAWGLPFAYPGPVIIPAGTPVAYTTLTCGMALLRFWEAGGCTEALKLARGVQASLMERFRYSERPGGVVSLGYTALDDTAVFNVAAKAAAYLLHPGLEAGPGGRTLARRLLGFILHGQRADGGWTYSPTEPIIDNSHSAMNLESLTQCLLRLEDGLLSDRCRLAVERGLAFYLDRLFDARAEPRQRIDAKYPVDIGTIAEAVAAFSAIRSSGLAMGGLRHRMERAWRGSIRLALRTLACRDGSFAARYYPPFRLNLHSLRWGNAQALRVLALTLRWMEDAPQT